MRFWNAGIGKGRCWGKQAQRADANERMQKRGSKAVGLQVAGVPRERTAIAKVTGAIAPESLLRFVYKRMRSHHFSVTRIFHHVTSCNQAL